MAETDGEDAQEDGFIGTIEAHEEVLTITFCPGFFDDVDTVAFDRRVSRAVEAARAALYLVAGSSLIKH